jgi:hypothetical protein
VGRWDGDTLVVETLGFNEESWLGWPGWIHSYEMKVIERFRREGNVLVYDVTVEDPYLVQPWVMDTRRIALNTNPEARFIEDLPCFERDAPHIVTKERG